jgi:hypothetical protein
MKPINQRVEKKIKKKKKKKHYAMTWGRLS